MLPIIKYRYLFLIFSGILVAASIAALLFFGLRLGIDFTGGSLLEVRFLENKISPEEIRQSLSEIENLGEVLVQSTPSGAILRFRHVDENMHQDILSRLSAKVKLEEERFTTIGPVIGQELKDKARIAILGATLAIMVYIAFAFRKVSKPVPSWQYGFIVAAVAFFHDLLIPLGVLAALGRFINLEIGIPIVAALLTVLGFSVHDTIVVFDRTRENLRRFSANLTFPEIVNQSVNQTLGRSVTTSLTTLFVVAAIYALAGETLRTFSLLMLIGIAVGTYSSIFVASPLLVEFQRIKLSAFKIRRK